MFFCMPFYEQKSGYPTYYDKAVRTALPALEYVGKKAWGYYRKKRKVNEELKKWHRNKKRALSKRVMVKMDGTTGGRYRMTKRKKYRKRKKSLRAQIKQVKRLIPKKSHKLFRDFVTYCFPGAANERRVFDVPCFTNAALDNYAQNLTLVDSNAVADYTTSNSTLQYDLYYRMYLKNNITANTHFAYAFFICKDDDNESPVDSIREELIDRGYSVPTVQAATGQTATSSNIPRRLEFDSTTCYHAPIFGNAALRRNWKMIGQVQKAVLGPGDTTAVTFSKKITYKPEVRDQEALTYISNYDIRLVIVLSGDLAHDQSNDCLVGRGSFQLDGEAQHQCNVTYSNPKALREVSYTDDLQQTGFNIPVHADNQASAIEIDEK